MGQGYHITKMLQVQGMATLMWVANIMISGQNFMYENGRDCIYPASVSFPTINLFYNLQPICNETCYNNATASDLYLEMLPINPCSCSSHCFKPKLFYGYH